MLDCHIIVTPVTDAAWQAQCVQSVTEAALHAGYPVHVHIVPWVEGHIGKARANGYAQGNQPFVTYVDDDDYLMPNAFAALGDAIRTSPDAIFAAEQTWQNGQLRDGSQRHHLAVLRRDQLIDHTAWKVCGDLQQVVVMRDKRVIDIPAFLYVHRLYVSGGRRLRRENPEELRRART